MARRIVLAAAALHVLAYLICEDDRVPAEACHTTEVMGAAIKSGAAHGPK
jgi:hypothetical protein